MFGHKNALQTFQRKINDVLRRINAFPYINNIMVASVNLEQHLEDQRLIFQRLKEHGLRLNLAKCTFTVDKVNFLR